jgi:murein DD-endopeptidase MepM/ murein hydrolase activator NlpD
MVCCFKGNFRVTSPYGERILNGKKEFHKGIDLVGLDDITVYSVSDGKVTTGFQANGAGNYIVVTMNDGRRVFYMHLRSFCVKNGQRIKKGEAIGIMGNTGNSFGAHTHLEIRPEGTSSKSLDINEYTDIPNKTGVYYYNPNEQREEEDELTQEKFDAMLDDYLKRRGAKAPSEWSEEARCFCETNGIIKGDSDGDKRYQSFITREEAAEVAFRLVKGLTGFTAVDK